MMHRLPYRTHKVFKRWPIVLLGLGVLLSGCALASDAAESEPLAVLKGRLLSVFDEVDLEAGEGYRTVLSWYALADGASGSPWISADQRLIQPDSLFEVPLHVAPPEMARVKLEDHYQGQVSGEFAVGFLSVVTDDGSGEAFVWNPVVPFGEEQATHPVAGREDLLVVFWAGEGVLDDTVLPLEGGTIAPGYSILQVFTSGEDEEPRYVPLPVSHVIDLDAQDYWMPVHQPCAAVVDPTLEAINPEDEVFEDLLADIDPETCVMEPCLTWYDNFECDERIGGLVCGNCVNRRLQVGLSDELPKAWTCLPRGSCDDEDVELCVLGRRYLCEAGEWADVASCIEDDSDEMDCEE